MVTLNGPPDGVVLDGHTGYLSIASPKTASSPARLLLLDANGRWLHDDPLPGGGPLRLAVNARTEQLVAAHDASVSIVDVRSGVLLQTLSMKQGVSAVAVDERRNLLYIASGSTAACSGPSGCSSPWRSTVRIVSMRDRRLLRTLNLDSQIVFMAKDSRANRLVVVGLSKVVQHVVYILDAWTGRLLYSLPLGQSGAQMVVDEASGRTSCFTRLGMFFTNQSGTVSRCRAWTVCGPPGVSMRRGRRCSAMPSSRLMRVI